VVGHSVQRHCIVSLSIVPKISEFIGIDRFFMKIHSFLTINSLYIALYSECDLERIAVVLLNIQGAHVHKNSLNIISEKMFRMFRYRIVKNILLFHMQLVKQLGFLDNLMRVV